MLPRTQDWFSQAERDLEHARLSREAGHHEWACFASQQAAEKAVKALHAFEGRDVWGDIISRLLQMVPDPAGADLIEKARVLDNFNVPSRYPAGHKDGPPHEHYGPIQSREAVSHAEEIVAFVRARMA